MNLSLGAQPKKTAEQRKPYVSPACKLVSPGEAKEFLMQKADVNDPEVRHMLRCIEDLQEEDPKQQGRSETKA